MKELDRHEFHNEYKNYFTKLIDFFEENDISYSLAYGTLLGAYRSGDMIEWDSDIDLFITKENELKIKNNVSKLPDCFQFDDYSTGKTFFMLDRIIIKKLFRKNNESERECWIDLFIVEPTDDIKANYKIWKKISKQLKYSDFKYRKKGNNPFKSFLRRLVGAFIADRKHTNLRCERIHRRLTNKNNDCFGGLYEICGAPFSNKYTEIKFGNRNYKCFNNAEKILTHLYGTDFMTPKKYNVPTEQFFKKEK